MVNMQGMIGFCSLQIDLPKNSDGTKVRQFLERNYGSDSVYGGDDVLEFRGNFATLKGD